MYDMYGIWCHILYIYNNVLWKSVVNPETTLRQEMIIPKHFTYQGDVHALHVLTKRYYYQSIFAYQGVTGLLICLRFRNPQEVR